jgi:anti-sigma B factor antagonist
MTDTDTPTGFGVRRVDDATAVIAVRGELTGGSEEALTGAWARAADPMTKKVVLDFTDLEYMNSTGIGLLVTLLVRAQRQRQQLVAFGLSDHYRQILGLTRLDEVIRVVGSEAEAIAA